MIVLESEHANTGKGGKQWSVMDMRRALKERLAAYKIPQEMRVVKTMGKNAMGKGESSLSLLPRMEDARCRMGERESCRAC